MWEIGRLVVFISRPQCNLCAGCMVKSKGENHHTRMTFFVGRWLPHFAFNFFRCVFLNPDTQGIVYMCNMYTMHIYHLPLNKPTIHVGIIDHTHRVPGKFFLRLLDFGRLDIEVCPVVFFSSTEMEVEHGPGPFQDKVCWSQAVLCFY